MKSTIVTWNVNNEAMGPEQLSPMLNKLDADRKAIIAGEMSEADAVEYIEDLISKGVPYTHEINRPDLLVWHMDYLHYKPSEAHFEFVCIPTFMVTGLLVYGFEHFDSIRNYPEIEKVLQHAFEGCMWCGFGGHGYDAISGFLDVMSIFAEVRLDRFLKRYPEISPTMTEKFAGLLGFLQEIADGKVIDQWTNKPYEGGKVVMYKYRDENDMVPVFVYGTLKKGFPAHAYLRDAETLGDFVLYDYTMYDLGAYPGIVPEKDAKVKGEVYLVPKNRIPEMDRYEGEGDLYFRKSLKVFQGWEAIEAMVYVYGYSVKGKRKIKDGEWKSSKNSNSH